jgi:predicted NBD/HSP70 family sugar kinase
MRELKRGTVRDLRRDNRAAVLWSLYLRQSHLSQPAPPQRVSRPDLSAATGLSAASVTNVVRELLDEGIVRESGLADSDGGRPRAMLEMNLEYGYVIGVDVGETRTRIGMFDLTMAERAKIEYPLNARKHDVGVVVGQILSGLKAVVAGSGVDPAKILGVGIGVPGIIQQGPEVIVHGQTYGWDAVPLERLLREGGLPPHLGQLFFDNGAKTMGQAELWFGAGRGTRNAIVVLIGSGVGASLISGGSTYRAATSSGAEFGHITVVAGGRKCRCGASGCLTAYAGAEAILERYGRPITAMGPGTGQDQEAALAELIAAAGSSPLAAAILEEASQYLGAGIGSLINLFNPERVILCGWAGLLLGGRLLPAIRESAERHSLRHPFAATSIELGLLGPESVVLGAATLPLEGFLNGTARRRLA